MFHHLKSSFSGIPHKVWMLTIVSFINRCGAMVICFLTLYLTEKLHFSLEEAGYIMSIYGIGAIAGAYLGGHWTDKYGYQNVQVLTLIGNGIMLLVLLFQRNYWSICAALFVLNLVSEGFRPANSVAISVNSDDETRTRSYSLLRVGVNLAITFALSIGGWLITKGWELIFWVDAITCFAAAAFIWFYIPNTSKKSTIVEEIKVVETIEIENQNPYKDKNFLIFIGLTLVGAMIFMQIVWTVPPFFKQIYKWDEAKIGVVSAVNGFIVMLVEMPIIFNIQNKRSAMWFVRLGLILYGLAYIAFVLPIGFALFSALFYMVVISFGEIFVMPFSTTYVTQVAPEATQGKYLALYTMAYSIANVFAPMMGTQIIAKFGFDTLWCTLAAMSLLTLVGFLYLEKRIKGFS